MSSPGKSTRDQIESLLGIITPFLQAHPGLQRVVHGALKMVLRPPYRRDDMETLIGPWVGASSASCEQGRQLGENHTFPTYYQEKRYETSVSNLGGSRTGHPINRSALKAVLASWLDSIIFIDFVRSKQVTRLSLPDGPLSYMDVLVLAEIVVSTPAYLLRRVDGPVASGAIPAAVASAYKLLAGVTAIIGRMIAVGDERLLSGPVPDARLMHDYADDHGLFIAEDGEACGGPERKVIELLELCVHGAGASANPAQVERGISDPEFFDLVGDGGGLVEYGVRSAAIKFAFELFGADLEQTISEALANVGDEAGAAPGLESLQAIADASVSPKSQQVRIDALHTAVMKMTGVDLAGEIARIEREIDATIDAIPELELDLGLRSGEVVEEILLRYLIVARAAAEFSFEHQQHINRLLGRKETQALPIGAVVAKIHEQIPEVLLEFVGVAVDRTAAGRVFLVPQRD